jgi:fructose-bisphosphate aldolase, class II
MPLVKMSSILKDGMKEGYGVGAFSVSNMEMVMGAVKAAHDFKSPIILQVAQVRLPYSPIEIFGPIMIAAAKEATVPIAVHFDHGTDLEYIMKALDLGFTSVMIDASLKPIDENIEIVKQVKELADQYDADVEAEVGQLAGSEDGSAEYEMLYSKPEDVRKLYKSTGIDAIALSIGNAHGLYKKEPKLRFDILYESQKQVPIPLVLHGGSGISDEDFRKCIKGGIHKINVATASYNLVEQYIREYCKTNVRDYFTMSHAMVQGAYESVSRYIKVFGSNNRV